MVAVIHFCLRFRGVAVELDIFESAERHFVNWGYC